MAFDANEIEQIKQAMRDVLAEVAGGGNDPEVPLLNTAVIEGPDEWGRVKYAGLPRVWVLDPQTLKRDNLTEQQKRCIQLNVGCSADGVVGPVGPFVTKFIPPGKKYVSLCWKVKPGPGNLWVLQNGSALLDAAGNPDTVASRYDSVADFLADFPR